MPNSLQSARELVDTATLTVKSPQRQYIKELASRKIQGFQGTIDEHGEYLDNVYRSNRSLAASIASDYRNRFLIELVQNAYDAHPVGTQDGIIDITLVKHSGESGTLFIANKGHPFAEDNVRSLCDIGLSQKPLDASIGNKGLGFRSVIQITDTPRIYSQCPDDPGENRFSGFCFRFAEPKDYSDLIDNLQHRKLARSDLPIFHLPVCIDKQNDAISGYAKAGFSTVIELPLRDADSERMVRDEINHLREQKVPLLLFLNRVASLIVRVIDGTGQSETEFTFTRSEEQFPTTEMELSRVCLKDAGQFLVARQSVPEATMNYAIRMGISSGELNEYWERWSGDGEVAVALRLDSNVVSPRLYTFLPMGEQAVAPFPGYLHGSFSPSSNRKSLDAGIQLNAELLKESTNLAAKTIHHIIADTTERITEQLAVEERATAVVDLLCWAEVDSLEVGEKFAADLARRLSENFGVSCFDAAPVVPCLSSESIRTKLIWQPPAHVRRWPDDTEVFAAEVAVSFSEKIKLWPIWSNLGTRIDELEKFLCVHASGYLGAPTGEERAQLVSLVAKKLGANSRTPKYKWHNFFSEVPDFMGRDGKCLAGLPVLLGDDGQLHNAMSHESFVDTADQPSRRRRRIIVTAVFSPPDPRRASNVENFEVDPPKKLSKRFAFLHSKYPWHGELSDARKYLEENKLVEEFDREAVLSHLSRTLRDEKNKAVLRGGLRWAFHLWRQPRDHGRPIKLQPQHRFRVPTLSNEYVEASVALFSANWPDETVGKLLQDFLDEAPNELPDLERLADRRLAAPDHPTFDRKWLDDWVEFLKELGVNMGLTPELKSARSTNFSAYRLSNFGFAEDYGIPLKFAEFWRNDISAHDSSLLDLPSTTNYAIQDKLSWLPGQADFALFSESCKKYFAMLILDWLSKDSDLPWNIEVHHQVFYQADRRTWPTPLKSFLRSACWMLVDDPVVSTSESIGVQPCEVWVNDTSDDRFDSYLRRPSRCLRVYFKQASNKLINKLKVHCGLRIFDDPLVLPEQLEFLSDQYTSEGFDRYFQPHLINFYNRTWRLLTNHLDSDEHEFNPSIRPSKILVRKQGEYELVSMLSQDDESEHIYVCDTDRQSDLNLLEASGRPFFMLQDVDGQKVGALFEALFGKRIRRLSQVKFDLLADGMNLHNCVATPALDICPQLRAMLAVAMEALTDTEAQRLPSDRAKVLARLERLNMIKAGRVSFVIDGMDVSTNQGTNGAFHFKFDNSQSVIAVQSSAEWDWGLVDLSILAICEALGHTALAPHLRLLIAHLRAKESLQEMESHPSNDAKWYSTLLRLSPSASHTAYASLSAGVERHAPWIRAVLHLLAGSAAVDAFDREGNDIFTDPSLFLATLSRLLGDSPGSAEKVVDICRTALGAGDFRKGLELDFGNFNASLEELGLKPETHPNLHRSRLEIFVREQEINIINCLRVSCTRQLDNMQPVENYAAKRNSIRDLEPNPAWLTVYEEPPENVLIEHVNVWLAAQNAPSLDCDSSGLEPLAQVRDYNQQFVNDFAQRAIPLVRTWLLKYAKNQQLESLEEIDIEALLRRLDEAGVLDFRTLKDITLMRWLQVLELWPTGMTLSLDLKVLGISQADLTAENRKAIEEKQAQEREARSISFNGRLVDPNEVGLLALSEELHHGLSSRVLEKGLGWEPHLIDVDHCYPLPLRGTGGGNPQPRHVPHIREEKAELVGGLGELTVYYWLRKKLPNQDLKAAWQSKNGTLITGRHGDDGLGYDFIVSYRKQLWQIEVKASLGDPRSFAMGETEVRAAREAARARSGVQYKIAYVSDLSNPNETDIEILPNPMTEEGSRVLELLGEGIRYGFIRN